MSAPACSAFISYSRDDSEFALRLAKDLKAAGASVWLDQLDIPFGGNWDNAIEDALIAAQYMVLILSPASARSNNVRDEISYALEQGKIVIPVLYMDCTVPLRLQRKQRIDFRADYTRGLTSLLDQLRVANPDQSVLDQAGEDEARRRAAWAAREAETQRRNEIEEQRQEKETDPLPTLETPFSPLSPDEAWRLQREAADREVKHRAQERESELRDHAVHEEQRLRKEAARTAFEQVRATRASIPDSFTPAPMVGNPSSNSSFQPSRIRVATMIAAAAVLICIAPLLLMHRSQSSTSELASRSTATSTKTSSPSDTSVPWPRSSPQNNSETTKLPTSLPTSVPPVSTTAAQNKQIWVSSVLYGADNEVASARRVTITESTPGSYQVYVANQFGFRCSLTFDQNGNPAQLRNCISKEELDWKAKETEISLKCNTRTTEVVCSGKYTLQSGTYGDASTFVIAHKR